MRWATISLCSVLVTTVISTPLEITLRESVKTKRNESSLELCLATAGLSYSVPAASDFQTLAKPYNLRLPYKPAVIVLPSTVDDVSAAVQCAQSSQLKVQARSGGHSYASFSLGGQDGSMVIDLEKFQNITVNGNIATVGAGVRLGNLALGIFNLSKAALPHGTCPGVGIGGHATHGGFGYSSRAWGLTLDNIIGMDTILANGTRVLVTEDSCPDLWYALRGAAADFGVVITFQMRTWAAPQEVVNYAYSLPGMFENSNTSAEVFQHIQTFALNSSVVDRNLGLGVYLDGSTFSVSGTYFGSLSDFQSKIAPELLRGLPTPTSSSVRSLSWLDSLTALANGQPLQQPLSGYDQHDDFFAKSVVTPGSSPLTYDTWKQYCDYIIKIGPNGLGSGNSWFSIINLYGGPDSQIDSVPSTSSAYSDRGALWVVQHYGSTQNTGSVYPLTETTFIDGLNTALEESQEADGTLFGAYQNYVDPSLSAMEAHELYYGDQAYQRLLSIKSQVDPNKLFWNPQSVGN